MATDLDLDIIGDLSDEAIDAIAELLLSLVEMDQDQEEREPSK